MSVIIVQFGTEQKAREKISEFAEDERQYDKWAGNEPPFTLDDIRQHQTLPIWFFSGSACVKHGGLGREKIIEDIESLTDGFEIDGKSYPNTFTVEAWEDLIGMGYLPEPPQTIL